MPKKNRIFPGTNIKVTAATIKIILLFCQGKNYRPTEFEKVKYKFFWTGP